MIRSFKDLLVYQSSYSLAMKIFWLTKTFPKEELYSLTDQIRRASRSVGANIVEGWAKRQYENVFKRHLLDAIGSCEETRYWIGIAYDCQYLSDEDSRVLTDECEQTTKMLCGLLQSWKTFDRSSR